MKVAVLVSGGKDSALALYRVLKKGYDVKYLVTMLPQREDSWMFHHPNISLTGLFAEAAGIPLVKTVTAGAKEEEIEDLKRLLQPLDVEGIVSGAVSSVYQKTRIDFVCKELSLKSIVPLWHEDPLMLINELIELGFEAIFVGVYAFGFDQDWLGRRIDRQAMQDLIILNSKYQVSLVGEGGEYETLVLDAPFLKKRIKIVKATKIWQANAGYLLVEEAKLVEKA